MSTKQQTLKAPISFSGKGLHTGVKVNMTVNPADAGTGIVFRRTDIEGQPIIPALCDNVVDTSRGTTIEAGGYRVHTIEHVMSALWTLGVDNAVIDIDAEETPIMDGSACAYAQAITETGLEEQQAERAFYHVTEKMVYTIPEKGVAIILYPDDEFSVSVHVDYNSKVIGNQYATLNPGDDYAGKISPCRTFVFLHELEPLIKMNLIKGGDLDNAIVVVENPVPEERMCSCNGNRQIAVDIRQDICADESRSSGFNHKYSRCLLYTSSRSSRTKDSTPQISCAHDR